MGKAVRFDGDYEINVPDGNKITLDVGQTGVVEITGSLEVAGLTKMDNISNLYIPGGQIGYTIITDGQGNLRWENPVFGLTGYTGSASTAPGYTGSRGPYGITEISFNMPGELQVGQGMSRWYIVEETNITGIIASVSIPPTDNSIIFDVKKNGSTIFTSNTKPTILSNQYVDSTLRIPNISTLSPGDYLTVDVIEIGTTITGSGGLVRVLIGI